MAILKNTVINDTGFLQLPTGTTAQRPVVAAGQMRYNTTTSQAEFYNAGTSSWLSTSATGVVATGGTVYDVDVEGTTYRVHAFTTTGNSTFTVVKSGPVEYLIVGGGGSGGGTRHAGGGGGGGLLTGTIAVTPQSYTIAVGAGGAGNFTPATSGSPSSAVGLTAIGGGGGADASNGQGMPGGSGGGASRFDGFALGTAGQGNNGGTGSVALNGQGAGGGGAGQIGGPALAGFPGGSGGNGLVSSLTGISQFYAAGGGGGGAPYRTGGTPGAGGLGGGGAGNNFSTPGVSGTPNTGGGGGGCGGSVSAPDTAGAPGGAGGSGIVIIRYPLRQANPVVAAGKVIGDGLLLDLDFAKPTVYSGSGTVVNDSRLNGITGTLVNGPVFINPRTNRSAFSNSSTSYISLLKSALDGLTSWTIDFWLQRNTTNNTIDTFLTCGSGNDFLWFFSSGLIVFQNPAETTMPYPTITNGVPFNFTATGANGVVSVYNNAALVGTMNNNTTIAVLSTIGIILGQEMDSQSGGFDPNQSFIGNYYSARFYNRVLSQDEVAQSFEATRWRFGI